MRKPPASTVHGSGTWLQHEVEQRRHAFLRPVLAHSHIQPCLADPIENGEVELVVGRIEHREEVEYQVDDLGRAGVRADPPC